MVLHTFQEIEKKGIFPNMSIYENMVIPLYKVSRLKPLGISRFIKWGELNGIFDWEVERLSIKTGPKSNLITLLVEQSTRDHDS